MITWRSRKVRVIEGVDPICHLCVGDCLSTDTKPTEGIYNGSALYEMDTKKAYKFNAETKTWVDATVDEALTTNEVEEIYNA